jgi:hypothetical protein
VPLLPVDDADKGKLYTVTVDFTDPGNPTIYDTDPASTPDEIPEVRRFLPSIAVSTEYKPFDEWDSTDADISPAILSDYIGSSLPVLLRLFVVSFGIDFTGALYSIPVWIGDGNILFEDLIN